MNFKENVREFHAYQLNVISFLEEEGISRAEALELVFGHGMAVCAHFSRGVDPETASRLLRADYA